MAYPFFLFTIGITTASASFLGMRMLNKINDIKQDWQNERCKPHVQAMAFIPGIAPTGVDPNRNYQDCQYGMAKGFFGAMITPFQSIIVTITSVLKEFSKNIDNIRVMINQMRVKIRMALRNIISKIYNLYTRVAWLFNRIIQMIAKLAKIFESLFGVLLYAFYTLGSIWNGLIGDTARFFCFDENTIIEMDNGNYKRIKDINVGDKLSTGIVLGCMKFTREGSEMFNYKGIKVAGCHLVKEDNKWIRVEDSSFRIPIQYNKPYIYCLYTNNAIIKVNNIEFSDYLETDTNEQIYQIYHFIKNHLNNNFKEKIGKINNTGKNNNLYPWCMHPNTKIELEKSKTKLISKCRIGDKIKGGKIIGITKFINKSLDLYNYHDTICTGSMLVNENNFWIPVYESIYATKITNNDPIYYNICTDSNIFYSNEIMFRDFEQISSHDVNEAIDNYVIENKKI